MTNQPTQQAQPEVHQEEITDLETILVLNSLVRYRGSIGVDEKTLLEDTKLELGKMYQQLRRLMERAWVEHVIVQESTAGPYGPRYRLVKQAKFVISRPLPAAPETNT